MTRDTLKKRCMWVREQASWLWVQTWFMHSHCATPRNQSQSSPPFTLVHLFFNSFSKSFGNVTWYIYQNVAHQLLDLGEAAVLSGSVSLMEPVGFGARVGFLWDVRHRIGRNISWLQACWSGIIQCERRGLNTFVFLSHPPADYAITWPRRSATHERCPGRAWRQPDHAVNALLVD